MAIDKATSHVSHLGAVVDHVDVSIGPRFLDLFSSNLYSSPNKAFEELVSNSWDAGAQTVYISLPDNLSDPNAAVWVLDDGNSMDISGLRALWTVAKSPKRVGAGSAYGRPEIGKFGIGKLATYLLAHELTYICCAADGVVRALTMDYREIDNAAEHELHIPAVRLNVRTLNDNDLRTLLAGISRGSEILRLIKLGIPQPKAPAGYEDEFGGDDPGPMVSTSKTWTLALLSSLKDAGKAMQAGRIRWLLTTSLPLGSSMSIVFNGSVLSSPKTEVPIDEEWIVGVNLGIDAIKLPSGETRKLIVGNDGTPYVTFEGTGGRITGKVRLYKDFISGGKSATTGSSNGYLINIRGRVINPLDPYFGLSNLNHSAWAKFRATIRADYLDSEVAVNREGLRDGTELQAFQALLHEIFNKVRTAHDAAKRAAWPNVGEILTDSWGTVPVEPLRQAVLQGFERASGMPEFVDASGVSDAKKAVEEWNTLAANEPGRLIEKVVLEDLSPEDRLVKYSLSTRNIVVNRSHPFSQNHSETREQQEVLRDTALVDLLTTAFMSSIGISEATLREISDFRDQTFRLIAQVRRRSGSQLAVMLIKATDHAKAFENIVGDALEYLGFVVQRLAQPGQPEGVATAPTTRREDDKAASYSFTYDAKSTGKKKAKTGNLNIAGLARHRGDHGADHTLVVAPDFEMGALQKECRSNHVTPMRAHDLASLLMLTAAKGPVDLDEFRSLFELFDPDEVHKWVEATIKKAQATKRLPLIMVLSALEEIGFSDPDAITTSVVARHMRSTHGTKDFPTNADVKDVIYGLSVLVPHLVRLANEAIILGTSPAKIRLAVLTQLQEVPPEYRLGIDQVLNTKSA